MNDDYIFNSSEIDIENILEIDKKKYRVIKKNSYYNREFEYYPQSKFLWIFWITWDYSRCGTLEEAWDKIKSYIEKKKRNKKEIFYWPK